MEDNIALTNSLNTVQNKSSNAKTSKSSKRTNKSQAKSTDPYKQMFMSMLSQTQPKVAEQQSKDEPQDETSGNQGDTVQDVKSIMLSQTGAAQIEAQNILDLQDSGSAQTVQNISGQEIGKQGNSGLQDANAAQNAQTVKNIETTDALLTENVLVPEQSNAKQAEPAMQQIATISVDVSTAKMNAQQPSESIKNDDTVVQELDVSKSTNAKSVNDATAKTENDVQTVDTEMQKANVTGSDSVSGSIVKATSEEADTKILEGTKQKSNAAGTSQNEGNTVDQSSVKKVENTEQTSNKEDTKSSEKDLSKPDTSETIIKKSDVKETDTSKLQVSTAQTAGASQTTVNVNSTEKKAAEPDISSQIKTGINNCIASGKSEFTVKLQPESLGEITLKLIRENGKTTLTITTASAGTAKLINDDLPALKEAVAQMNVHVEAVTHAGEAQQGGMQFGNMTQQFTGQQQQGSQASVKYAGKNYGSSGGFANDVPDNSNQTVQKSASSGLNTYI